MKSHWEELASWEFWQPEKRLHSQLLRCSAVTNHVSLWRDLWWERMPKPGTADHLPPWQEPYILGEFQGIKPDNITKNKSVDGDTFSSHWKGEEALVLFLCSSLA